MKFCRAACTTNKIYLYEGSGKDLKTSVNKTETVCTINTTKVRLEIFVTSEGWPLMCVLHYVICKLQRKTLFPRYSSFTFIIPLKSTDLTANLLNVAVSNPTFSHRNVNLKKRVVRLRTVHESKLIQFKKNAVRSSRKAYLIHQTESWRVSSFCFSHWLLEARTSTRQKQWDTISNKENDGTLHTSYFH